MAGETTEYGDWTDVPDGAVVTSTQIDMGPGSNMYTFQMRAENDVGPGLWSDETDVKVTDETESLRSTELINMVPANWSLIPAGLGPGDEFRLIFVTYTGHSANSEDIVDYNNYIQSQANASNAHPGIRQYSSSFRILGCTSAVNARQNTQTEHGPTDRGVQVYWLNGPIVAENYTDLYDGNWQNENRPVRRQGTRHDLTDRHMFTGCANAAGDSSQTHPLGASGNIQLGLLNGTGGPLHSPGRYVSPTGPLQYFALSGVFMIERDYPTGINVFNDPTTHENCYEGQYGENWPPATVEYRPCVLLISTDHEDAWLYEGRTTPSTLAPQLPDSGIPDYSDIIWIVNRETLDFVISMDPLPAGIDVVTVDYGTADLHCCDGVPVATRGLDYSGGLKGSQGSITFRAGGFKEFVIPIEVHDDRIEDSGEQMELYIYNCEETVEDPNNPGTPTTRSCETYSIVNGSGFGTIYNTEEPTADHNVSVSDPTVTEGDNATADFVISLDSASDASTWVSYETENGTAVAGTDYTATQGEVLIPSETTSITVSVPILNDEQYTGQRNFTLKLSGAVNALIGKISGTATIKDDEPAPLQAHFTNIPSGDHGESSFTFNISFNHPVSAGHQTMQNSALTVTNGRVTSAERVNQQSDHWRITIEPNGGADVTVHLPATESCAADGAVCTHGDAPLPLSNSITHTFPGTQLNAKFEAFQGIHNGKDAFIVKVVFSEEVNTTADQLLNHAFTVENATLAEVIQASESSKRGWNITIKPTGPDDIKVTLLPATDCETDGQICTPDGELLTGTLVGASEKPVLISVSEATATEGDEATLTFTVSTDRIWLPQSTVDYATSDGTANAGEDYTETSGTLTFSLGNAPLTVTVPVLNDEYNEDAETGTIQDQAQPEEPAPDSEPTGLPVITGTPQADAVLTADTSAITDANGLTEVSYSYQWIITTDGTDADVGGATASTHTPRAAHVGRTFKVRVSFTDDDDYQHTLTSEPTTPITQNTDAIVWSADMLVVEYTEISIGAATADLFSNTGGSGNLQIKSLWSYVPDQDLRLAFTDTFDDAGDHTLIVGDLTLEFPAGSSGEQSFKWTNVDLDWQDGQTIAVRIVPTTPAEPVANTAATGEPTISGTAQVGQRLTADTSAISDIADGNGLDNANYTYQWTAGGSNIDGATGSSLTLTSSQESQTVQVRESFTDDDGFGETATSVASSAVAAAPAEANKPATGLPTISGTPQVEQTLTADTSGISDQDGLSNVSYSYQWMADDADIQDATDSAYTLTAAEEGQTIKVRVSFTDRGGHQETLTSTTTIAVAARTSSDIVIVDVPGTVSLWPELPRVGTVVRATLIDPDGLEGAGSGAAASLGAVSWQWARSSEGSTWTSVDVYADGDSYTPTEDDEGMWLKVTAVYTDGHGQGKSAEAITAATVGAREASPELTVTELVTGLTHPWDIAFTPDGTMLFTERDDGLRVRLTDGTVRQVTADFSDLNFGGTAGLLALVLDPDFVSNRRFYTYQRHTGAEMQLIAWTIDADYTTVTRVADPLVGGIPRNRNRGPSHGGGRLRFGPQGYLWVATGDGYSGTAAQDLSSLGGKVLRVDSQTGAGAPDNPFAPSPVYTYGHRNPQGLALRPGTSQMWSVEHGPNHDDEINLLVSGGNYGWDPAPDEGAEDLYDETTTPMTDLVKFPDGLEAKWSSGYPTLAVGGGVFLEGSQWREWEGQFAVATLKTRSVRVFKFTEEGDLVSQVVVPELDRTYGRLRTAVLGPDGALYITTTNGGGKDKILKVVPANIRPRERPPSVGRPGWARRWRWTRRALPTPTDWTTFLTDTSGLPTTATPARTLRTRRPRPTRSPMTIQARPSRYG